MYVKIHKIFLEEKIIENPYTDAEQRIDSLVQSGSRIILDLTHDKA